MSDPLKRARHIVSNASPRTEELEEILNDMSNADRLAFIRGLGRREQRRLYDAVLGRAVSIDDMVPQDVAPMVEVIHEGRNTLPSFNYFQKRFCRSPYEEQELYGFNKQAMSPFTGPGYFVAYDDKDRGEVAIDYRRIPSERPAIWPEIMPNTARLGRFVYHGTVDMMRRVSQHVTIGRAHRGAKALPAWFVLCRVEW